ncbi:MAG: 2-hydroxyacid dehydrogenase, partial [Acidimicrobiales bacterium]
DERIDALGADGAVLGWMLDRELHGPSEFDQLASARLVQLLSAGVDQVPFDRIPHGVPVASNAGAYAAPMAEHVLAMTLALAKHLPDRHAEMKVGIFDQQSLNLELRGSVVCIVGFGGIGRASAALFRALGAHIHAVTRAGVAEDWVERADTLDDLDVALAAADVVVLSIPLTRVTRGLIGTRSLSRMKPDAVLVNVARGAIVDETALYEHLVAHPGFRVGIDTWWDEPRGGEQFSTAHPFFDLPNVLGSPHNSGMTASAFAHATRDAAANVARALRGEAVAHLVDRREYLG